MAAQAYREEARVQEYYAANEAAAEIAAGFDPGFASAIYASFGVGDAAVGRAAWGGLVGGGGGRGRRNGGRGRRRVRMVGGVWSPDCLLVCANPPMWTVSSSTVA